MHDLTRYTTDTFLPALEAFANDKSAQLRVPALILLQHIPQDHITPYIIEEIPEHTSRLNGTLQSAAAAGAYLAGGGIAALLGATGKIILDRTRSDLNHNTLIKLIQQFDIVRHRTNFSWQELKLMRALGQLVLANAVTPSEWQTFVARFALNNSVPSSGILVPDDAIAAHKDTDKAKRLLQTILSKTQPVHDVTIADIVSLIARAPDPTMQQALEDGSRWLEVKDLPTSSIFTSKPDASSLLLGNLDKTSTPVYFNGPQSLITIGAAGQGKSQAHIVSNLLHFPGSAVILDPSGELWQMTAGYRQAKFGPVYRFSPTDPDGRTHRFNPFDAVSRAPNTAAVDCEVFSHEIIADNPRSNDKFWDNSARDILWAFALAIALRAPPHQRNMSSIAQLISMPFPPGDPFDIAFTNTDSGILLDVLDRIATDHNIPEAENITNRIRSAMVSGTKALDSILSVGRTGLSGFSRSILLRNAIAASDWRPEQLRRKPGTTVYLVIPEAQITAYAPIIRVLFQTHLQVLTRMPPAAGEPPITFFIDEMPRLKRFESMLTMQDTGRKHGLRLWMFAQSLGQVTESYGRDRGNALVEGCRIRMFMAPDKDAYNLIEPMLGETRNALIGDERRPLATLNDLAGRKHGHQIVAMTAGEHPMLLDKIFGHVAYKHMFRPPPTVPVASTPSAPTKPTPSATP